jgi:hypothetical protein
MNRDDKGNAAEPGHQPGNAAETAQSVSVDDAGVAFLPQQRGEIERHEIAAHGNQLPPPLRRKSQDGHESVKAPDFGRFLVRRVRQLRAIDDRLDVIFPQALKQPFQRRLRAAPLGAVEFSKDMDGSQAHAMATGIRASTISTAEARRARRLM